MNLRRTAANAAILTALSMVLMPIMWMVVIPKAAGLSVDDMMNPMKIAQFALGNHGLWTVACLSDAICGLTLPLVTIALYRKFKKSQPSRAALLGLFGVMASILFFAAGAISLVAPNFIGKLANPEQLFAALGAVQQPIEMAAVFLISVSVWFTVRAAHATNAFNGITLYAGYLGSLGIIMLPVSIVNLDMGANPVVMLPMIGAIVYNFGLGAMFLNPKKNPELEAVIA